MQLGSDGRLLFCMQQTSAARLTLTSVLTVVSFRFMKSVSRPLTSMLAAVPPLTTDSGTHDGSCRGGKEGDGGGEEGRWAACRGHVAAHAARPHLLPSAADRAAFAAYAV